MGVCYEGICTSFCHFAFRLDSAEAAIFFTVLLVEDLDKTLPAAEATFAEVRTLFLLAMLFTSFSVG